jgi:hypothetical protein
MDAFTKIIRIGRNANGSAYCKIQWDGKRLSITGVEGPHHGGDCKGSCGQINGTLRAYTAESWEFAEGWDYAKLTAFLDLWDEWHLNDMTAGSPDQEAYLKAHPVTYKYPQSHYEEACKALAAVGLHPDNLGYHYGSAWLHRDVPENVLEALKALPETDMKPAWV